MPEAHDKVLDNNPDPIGIWKCMFLRRGENRSTRSKTSRSKEENQQQTQSTYDAGSQESNPGHIGERRALSPLCHRVRQNLCDLMTNTFFLRVCIKILKILCSSKMCDGSEQSENKFCNPGQLSDAELFQLPAHSESAERKSTVVTNEGVHNFLSSQHRANKQLRKNLSVWTVL